MCFLHIIIYGSVAAFFVRKGCRSHIYIDNKPIIPTLWNPRHQLSNRLTSLRQTVSNLACVTIKTGVRGRCCHCDYHAAFVVCNYVLWGLAEWEDAFEKFTAHRIRVAVSLSRFLSLTPPPPPHPSSAFCPSRRAQDTRQRRPVQKERTTEEKEGHKEERQRVETGESKKTQEDCKSVALCLSFSLPATRFNILLSRLLHRALM